MPGVRRLLGFDAVSMTGDWIAYVGMSALAIDQGRAGAREGLALVVVLIAQAVPRVVCAPLAGALADRVDRRTLLVVATAARGGAALAMVAAALAGAPWWVHGAYVSRMALGAFTDVATRAALPRLVPARAIERANAWASALWSAAFLIGIAAGALVVAHGGVALAFALDATSFAIAALGFATLPAIAVAPRAASVDASLDPAVRRATQAKVPVSIAIGAAWIVLNQAAGQARGTATTLGALHLARGLGAMIAPLAWPRALRGGWRGVHVATGAALVGIIAFVAVDGAPPAALVGALVWGAGVSAVWTTSTALIHRTAADAQRGRAAARDLVAQTIAQCAGGLLAVAAQALGASGGALGILAALVAWAVIARRT